MAWRTRLMSSMNKGTVAIWKTCSQPVCSMSTGVPVRAD